MVYHLHINKQSWSTTSLAIKDSMKFIQSLIQEKTGLKVDLPDSSGGTTSTANVARRAFSDETDYLNCVLSTIAIYHRPALTKIHTQLATILKDYNSSRKVNTLELGNLCKDTYLLILDSFPSITPTLHKILAHSGELIRESNAGFGLKDFSEEGTESCNKLIRKISGKFSKEKQFRD